MLAWVWTVDVKRPLAWRAPFAKGEDTAPTLLPVFLCPQERGTSLSPESCSFLPVLPGPGHDKGLCCILDLTLLSSLCCQAFPRRALQAALEGFVNSWYFCSAAGNCWNLRKQI